MLKKLTYACLLFLFGINASSIAVLGIRIPVFMILLAVFGIAIGGKALIDVKNRNWHNLRENYIRKGTRYFIIIMCIWVLYGLLSFLWQRDFENWRIAVNHLVIGAFCAFVFPFFLNSKEEVLNAYRIMGCCAVAHNLIGWFEVITRIYLFPSLKDAIGWEGRPVSIFYNTNNFAVFLLFGVFIMLANHKFAQGKVVKIFWLLGTLSSALLILLTRSRGGMLALALGFGVFALLLYFSHVKKRVLELMKRKVCFFFLVILAITFLCVGSFLLYQIFFTGARADSGIARINLINNGIMFLGITYGRGVGAGNIEFWVSNYWGYFTYGILNMHNWWFEILVAYGIAVFLLYLVFYFKLAKSSLMSFIKVGDSDTRVLYIANLCILGSFVITSTIPSTLMPAIWFWAYMGVLIAIQKESII